MMYNPQLETFLRVADAGSFNKAAEELFITPPAVIKQITSLESGLGVKLFIRSPRGLKLTEAGKSIYRDAQYVIQYCKDSVVRAKNAAEDGEKVIRIGVSPMTPGQFLLDLWPGIKTCCPNIKFKMVPYENTPENSVEILRNLDKTSISWPGCSTRISWRSGSAPPSSCPGSLSAVQYPFTTRWRPKTG